MPDTAHVADAPATIAPATSNESFDISTPHSFLYFLRALDIAPTQQHGFSRADVKNVERYWEIVDGDWVSYGYVVELHDRRRAHLQYHLGGDDTEEVEKVEILPMQAEWWYPPIVGGGVQWIEDAAHINEHLSA